MHQIPGWALQSPRIIKNNCASSYMLACVCIHTQLQDLKHRLSRKSCVECSLWHSKLQFRLDARLVQQLYLHIFPDFRRHKVEHLSRSLLATELVCFYSATVLSVCENIRRPWGPHPLPYKNLRVHNSFVEHIADYWFLFTRSSNRLLTVTMFVHNLSVKQFQPYSLTTDCSAPSLWDH